MFNKAYTYSCKWRFKFNPAKCKIVIFGKDESPTFSIKLGGIEIDKSDCETHLGVGLVTNNKAEDQYLSERIIKCQTLLYNIKGIGSKSMPVLPKTGSKLYQSVIIPKLTYGLEVMSLNECNQDKLESFHCKAAKVIQCLPDHTLNVGCISTVGWMPIQSYIDIIRLVFMWKILLLPMSNIYKTVFLKRFYDLSTKGYTKGKGPTKYMLDTCLKYGIEEFVLESIENAEYCTLSQFKKMIKCIVSEKSIKMINATKSLYKSACYINNIISICMSPWWILAHELPDKAQQCRLIIQLLLNKDRHMHSLCNVCGLSILSIPHILFECVGSLDRRTLLWSKVQDTCPISLIQDLSNMNPMERCSYILSGMNSPYIPEWKLMYSKLAAFIYDMYKNH